MAGLEGLEGRSRGYFGAIEVLSISEFCDSFYRNFSWKFGAFVTVLRYNSDPGRHGVLF